MFFFAQTTTKVRVEFDLTCYPDLQLNFSDSQTAGILCTALISRYYHLVWRSIGNQEPLVVKDKVGRLPGEFGVSKCVECATFPFSALTLLVQRQEGHLACM